MREFITTSPALQKMLQVVLKFEMKEHQLVSEMNTSWKIIFHVNTKQETAGEAILIDKMTLNLKKVGDKERHHI